MVILITICIVLSGFTCAIFTPCYRLQYTDQALPLLLHVAGWIDG